MRKCLKHTTKLAFVVMGVGVICSYLGAQDVHAQAHGWSASPTYPGTMCQPRDPTSHEKLRYSSKSAYNASSTTTVFVKCPIPQLDTTKKLNYVIADVTDKSDGGTITCIVSVRGLDGVEMHQMGSDSDTYFGGNSDVFIGNMVYDGNPSYANMHCRLPKKVAGDLNFSINSYTVYHQDVK